MSAIGETTEEMSLDHLVIRLIEMGRGGEAVPAMEAAVQEILARSGGDGGFELEELRAHLLDGGRGDVAQWIDEAVEYLARNGAPATALPAEEPAPAARDLLYWCPAPHAQVDREAGNPDFLVRGLGYRSLSDLRFQVAHAFEGSKEIRTEHYRGIADLVLPGDRVLDVGCGDGTFLELVRSRGARGVGVELDPEKVALCRGLGLEVRHCRAQELSAQGETFDFVAMIQIIEHLSPDDALSVLDSVCRMLSPGGRLFIVTPNFANPFVAHTNFWLDVTHVRPYPEPLLRRMCTALGFPHVQSGTMGEEMDTWCYAFRRPEDAIR